MDKRTLPIAGMAFALMAPALLAGCNALNPPSPYTPKVGHSSTDRYTEPETGDAWTRVEVFDALEAITVRGASYTAFRLKATDNRAEGAEDSYMWISDPEEDILRLDLFGDGTYLDFDPPCADPIEPFTVGRTFNELCRAYVDIDGEEVSITLTFRGQVEAAETVTVPSGQFDAFRVTNRVEMDFGAGATFWVDGVEWYAESVCGGLAVKGESEDSDGKIETYENLSYSC